MLEIDSRELERVIRKNLAAASSELRFSFPLLKTDESRREIVGVATTEDCDAQGEVLLYDGSKSAFRNWAGNIREMHQPRAVGKSVSVEFDDAKKAVIVRAYVSRGAEDTWQKIREGVLTAYSVGGSRLRSEVRKDGVRVTSAWRLDELSLVDVAANPACRVSLAKVLRRDGELGREKLASALDAVAKQLAAGCRPLGWEVSRCLSLAGSTVTCDLVAARDWRVLGPPLAVTLSTLARGLRMSEATEEQAEKIVGAVPRALQPLLPAVGGRPGGAVAARLGKSSAGSALGADDLLDMIRGALREADAAGIPRTSDVFRDLEAGVMKIAAWRDKGLVPDGMQKRMPSLAWLATSEEKLSGLLKAWHEGGLPQGPEYHRLSQLYFRICGMRKRADARAMR